MGSITEILLAATTKLAPTLVTVAGNIYVLSVHADEPHTGRAHHAHHAAQAAASAHGRLFDFLLQLSDLPVVTGAQYHRDRG